MKVQSSTTSVYFTLLLFKKKIFEDISPFCGVTDTIVLNFWWHLLCVSKPEWAALFAFGWGIHVTWSLRFTSGLTPAEILAASLAAKLFSSMYMQASIGEARNWDLLYHHSQCETRQVDERSTDWAIPLLIYFFFMKAFPSMDLDIQIWPGNSKAVPACSPSGSNAASEQMKQIVFCFDSNA